MKRKIVQHGSSSLTVSLPYKWTKKFGLNKGDDVDIEENGSNIVISAGGIKTSNKATINIENKDKFLRRYIINLYKQGFDEIEILCADGLPIDKIKEVLNEVMGFEIIEQSGKRCLIKNVAQAMDSEFEPMLRRVFLMNVELASDILDNLKNSRLLELQELSKIQYTNNKLTNLCQRILNKRGYKEPVKTNYIYGIVDQLEQTGDHLGDLCEYFSKNNTKINKNILASFSEINKLLDASYKLFYSFDDEKMLSLKKRIIALNDDILSFFEKYNGKQLVLAAYLLQILERINHIGLYMSGTNQNSGN